MSGRRDAYLDHWRGLFHVVMVLDHLPLLFPGLFVFIASFWEPLGFVSVAEGFVFLSGYVTGLVYVRVRHESGPRAVWRKSLHRAVVIYLTYLAGVATLLSLAKLGGASAVGWGTWETLMSGSLPLAIGSAAALTWQPPFLEILPMYSLFLLFTPLIIRLLDEHRRGLVLFVSMWIWIADQFDARDRLLELIGVNNAINFGYFRSCAWQFLFVCGAICGHRTYGSTEPWLPRDWNWVAVACVGAALLFGMRHGLFYTVRPESKWVARSSLGPVRLLNFAYIGFLAARFRSQIGRLIEWRGLAFLSRQSLQVFAFHLVPIFAASLVIVKRTSLSWTAQLLFSSFSVGGLFAIAWISQFVRTRLLKPQSAGTMAGADLA